MPQSTTARTVWSLLPSRLLAKDEGQIVYTAASGGEMSSEQEDFMAVGSPSLFAQGIQEDLPRKRGKSPPRHEGRRGQEMQDGPVGDQPPLQPAGRARSEGAGGGG